MTNQSDKFPYLETSFSTKYSSILECLYEQVKASPICWLAYEQLEDVFSGNKITDDLSFHIDKGRIFFVEYGCCQPLATIHFDQAYVSFESSKTSTKVEREENTSLRYNRQPIKYSFEYFKRKRSQVKLR